MTKRQKRALLARRLRNRAEQYRKSFTTMFRNDPYLVEMIEKDYQDMRKAATLLRTGKEMKAAKLIVYDFDTAVRDEVPATVYNYLEKVYYGD